MSNETLRSEWEDYRARCLTPFEAIFTAEFIAVFKDTFFSGAAAGLNLSLAGDGAVDKLVDELKAHQLPETSGR